VTKPAFIGVN